MRGLNRNTGSAGPARRLLREATQTQPESAYGTVTLNDVVTVALVPNSVASTV
jgi:hypothetical protein